MSILPANPINPDRIIQKLSQFQEELHLAHFNTTSFSQHKALDFYDQIGDFKDRIGELLLGYYAPKRFTGYQLKIDIKSPDVIISDIINFSHELEKFADMNHFADLCNVAQELEGAAVKVKYMLTLK